MIFKGDAFRNRYRIAGELTATTPTHIGNGEIKERPRDGKSEKPKKQNEKTTQDVSLIALGFKDGGLRPYLPGSALRGNVRHYLLQIFRAFGHRIAADADFAGTAFRDYEESQQIDYMINKASLLEQLFGTPFSEGKIEFWDAPAKNEVAAPEFAGRGWDNDRQTYIVQSVSIDPETGAADSHKLYAFEVAPPGLSYEVNIVGQNLTDEELGFLLFGLYGFNSEIFPLTIGAMAGRGFGRMAFKVTNIYRIQNQEQELANWVKLALAQDHAGYNLLPKVTEPVDQLIRRFKDAFQARMKEKS